MDAIQAQQMALAADRQRQVQIGRIRRALSQMDQGEFGYCAECGKSLKRRAGLPVRRLCTAA